MPASQDESFYQMLDSVADPNSNEDAVAQNKRIKEARIAEDAREPDAAEVEAIDRELEREKKGAVSFCPPDCPTCTCTALSMLPLHRHDRWSHLHRSVLRDC
jgi:hypothetical protein